MVAEAAMSSVVAAHHGKRAGIDSAPASRPKGYTNGAATRFRVLKPVIAGKIFET